MSFDGQALFNLLPGLYRLKDAQLAQAQTLLTPQEAAELQALQALPPPLSLAQQEQLQRLLTRAEGPLQSLLALIAEQLAVVEENLDQFYDDQFIETCAPWVIPYIGDLIGYRLVKGVAPAVASPRAEVAHTISFRRRKGTILVLEQLARDVTGWGAHAVEFFKLLSVTQYMNHIRPYNHYAPDLRRWQPRAYMNTGFDATAHTVDVRRIAVQRGRYNIQNIGIFLWSLNAYSLTRSPLTAVTGSARCFRFSPLGQDMPLFNSPISQGADITAPAQPPNVPDRLRQHILCRDIQGIGQGKPAVYYGVGKSLVLIINGTPVDPASIWVCDLSGDDGAWDNVPPAGGSYAIDPCLGRLAVGPQAPAPDLASLQASFYYGFNGEMGGGEYPRANSFSAAPAQAVVRVPNDYTTIQAALDALAGDGVVEITDSGRYEEAGGVSVAVAAGRQIELRARDGCRPTLLLHGEMTVAGGPESAFNLNGLLVTCAVAPASPAPLALIHVTAGIGGATNGLSTVGLTHCTLVPGWALAPKGTPRYAGHAALLVEPAGVQVNATRSILGALRVNDEATVSLRDSVLDANAQTRVAYAGTDGVGAGGELTLDGCTVVGKAHATLLRLVCNSIVWAALDTPDTWPGPLWAERKQEGCVRFSYLPAGAVTPRRYHCAVAGEEDSGPLFASLRYGDPGYGKLLAATDDNVRRGADDGAEMGAFHFLLASLRETDLRVRLEEYLPVGLDYGIFYQT